jgi:hypothetical protein
MSNGSGNQKTPNIVELFDIVKSDTDIERCFEVATHLLISAKKKEVEDIRKMQLDKMRFNYLNSK